MGADERLHRLIAMGGDHLVAAVLGHELEGAEDAHDRHYRELRADACAFRGVADFLHQLHDHGLIVVIATSASEDDLEAMLKIIDANGAIDGHGAR